MMTTLNKIRKEGPCKRGWEILLKHLGKAKADDEPLSIATILESNGPDDAIWSLCAVQGYDREIRLFAVWCARQVEHLLTDPRSIAALRVAEAFANGKATQKQLSAAYSAAGSAAYSASYSAAFSAADSAAYSAALSAADSAAYSAAYSAALSAAYSAADSAAYSAALSAADSAARSAQATHLLEICTATKE